MNLQNRPPIFVPSEFRAEIEALSKAALMDLVWDLASVCGICADDPAEVAAKVREHMAVVLLHRTQAARAAGPRKLQQAGGK